MFLGSGGGAAFSRCGGAAFTGKCAMSLGNGGGAAFTTIGGAALTCGGGPANVRVNAGAKSDGGGDCPGRKSPSGRLEEDAGNIAVVEGRENAQRSKGNSRA